MPHNPSELPEVPEAIIRNQVVPLHSTPFQAEVLCGIWQLHAVATILVTRVNALYPGHRVTEHDLDRVLIPRDAATEDAATLCIVSAGRTPHIATLLIGG